MKSDNTTQKNMSKFKTIIAGIWLVFFYCLLSPAFAEDDDIPFFVPNTAAPNVMFIFDNSDSMQDIPYLRANGGIVRPGRNPNKPTSESSWRWRTGVRLNADNTIMEKDGVVQYDHAAFPSDEEMVIPEQTPSYLPVDSTMTSYGDANRIYDNSLDWTKPVLANRTTFELEYRYRVVEVKALDGDEAIQYGTIISRSTNSEYFKLEGNLTYTTGKEYSYTILTDGPGRVTRERTDLFYVTDADLDWTTINNAKSNWTDRTLVITEGTNEGESRRITSLHTISKYWRVDVAYDVPCDLTTRYKIYGTTDDDRYAFGGNHPASKLYQAKKALKIFLDGTCVEWDEDKSECTERKTSINMGFATYLSAKVPRVTATYYKEIEVASDRVCGTYLATRDSKYEFHNDFSATEFTTYNWWTKTVAGDEWVKDQNHTGMSVDSQFYKQNYKGKCNEQETLYTVTKIESDPGPDGTLKDRMKFTVESRVSEEGGYWYSYRSCYAVDDCADLPESRSSGRDPLIQPSEDCYAVCAPSEGVNYYNKKTYDTYGYYKAADTSENYVSRGEGGVCKNDDNEQIPCVTPRPIVSGYTLVTKEIEPSLKDVAINADGDTGSILSSTYDSSYFMYPGYGTTNNPHGWSYKKISAAWLYGKSAFWRSESSKGKDSTRFPKKGSVTTKYPPFYPWPGDDGSWDWSTWRDADQKNPYFPADIGDEMSNVTGDDQVVFVNLPTEDEGDDVGGSNIDEILKYTTLERKVSGDAYNTGYDFTIMPYTKSIAPNAYSALQYSGTPIAASLQDLNRYYESYIEQDTKTQQGCRKNFAIFLTDGLESGGGDPVQAATDLKSSTEVSTYVIGFGLDATSEDDLNAIAKAGDTDQAYFATNVEELASVLQEEVMEGITENSYSRSAPVITTFTPGETLRIYSSYFDYPSWRGHLRAYDVDGQGNIIGPAEKWKSNCDADEDGVDDADAGCIMQTNGRGTVYTNTEEAGKAPVRKEFSEISEDDLSAETIEYVLGKGRNDWFLGDIYNSKPVVVGSPKFTPPLSTATNDPYAGYVDFKDKEEIHNRETRIYVGANDGMVHAFKAEDGTEDWAYIPHLVWPKLSELRDGHTFTVDLPLKVADVSSDGDWRTLLVSGLREGGDGYFAIDVTKPSDPKILWEFKDTSLGETWSIPSFGRVMKDGIDGKHTHVIFAGGGISSDEDEGNSFYIFDAVSGVADKLSIGDPNNNVPSQALVISNLDSSSGNYGGTLEVYFGDTSGDLWKLTGLNSDSEDEWKPVATELYGDGEGKIFHRPTVSNSKGGCLMKIGGDDYNIIENTNFLIYGTGDETSNETIKNTDSEDHLYAIADPPIERVEKDDEGNTVKLKEIWQHAFEPGEKMLTDPFVHLGVTYFVTYIPREGCVAGESFLWGLTVPSCGSPGNEAGLKYDVNGNTEGGPWERISLGIGITSDLTPGGPKAYFQDPGGEDPTEIQLPDASRLEYWREDL